MENKNNLEEKVLFKEYKRVGKDFQICAENFMSNRDNPKVRDEYYEIYKNFTKLSKRIELYCKNDTKNRLRYTSIPCYNRIIITKNQYVCG
jgi:signal transduction histidine kinase